MTSILGIVASSKLSAPPGAYESIATATGTGSSGTITFSSIPSTYKHLQIRGLVLSAGTDTAQIRFNSDTGSNYTRHRIFGNGTTATASGSANTTFIILNEGSTSTLPNTFIVDVADYASTTKNKTVRSFSGIDQNGSGNVGLFSGVWRNTAAITSVTVFLNSGNYDTTSVISLYGIKG
jgi:hypothetical protein